MKHLKKGRKLSRTKNQRNAMLKTLLGSLILHEKIETTEAKAKEIKGIADGIISRAKQIKDNNKKLAISKYLHGRIPAVAAKKLTGKFIDNFSGRIGGYTRVIKLAPRKNDNARMAIIEFVKD